MRILILVSIIFIGLSCKKSDNTSGNTPYTPPAAVSGQWRKLAEYKDSIIAYPKMLGVGIDIFLLDGNAVYDFNTTTYTLTKKPNFPGLDRNFATVGLVLNNIIYYGLGYQLNTGDPSATQRNDFWQFNPSTGQWLQKASCPITGFSGAYAIAINGKAYIGSGRGNDGKVIPDLYQFDPVQNNWTKQGSYIGSTRQIYIAFGIGQSGYVGSTPDGQILSGLYEYLPSTTSWVKKKQAPYSPKTSFASESKGYIYGDGLGGNGNDFYEYDPPTDTWTKKNDFSTPGTGAVAGCFTNGKAYVLAKLSQSTNMGFAIWEYTP